MKNRMKNLVLVKIVCNLTLIFVLFGISTLYNKYNTSSYLSGSPNLGFRIPRIPSL